MQTAFVHFFWGAQVYSISIGAIIQCCNIEMYSLMCNNLLVSSGVLFTRNYFPVAKIRQLAGVSSAEMVSEALLVVSHLYLYVMSGLSSHALAG